MGETPQLEGALADSEIDPDKTSLASQEGSYCSTPGTSESPWQKIALVSITVPHSSP